MYLQKFKTMSQAALNKQAFKLWKFCVSIHYFLNCKSIGNKHYFLKAITK